MSALPKRYWTEAWAGAGSLPEQVSVLLAEVRRQRLEYADLSAKVKRQGEELARLRRRVLAQARRES
jgi:hypothetical protein